ncbi:hypothetical protein ACEPAF_9018 [Sanghuangporus sanghuang]
MEDSNFVNLKLGCVQADDRGWARLDKMRVGGCLITLLTLARFGTPNEEKLTPFPERVHLVGVFGSSVLLGVPASMPYSRKVFHLLHADVVVFSQLTPPSSHPTSIPHSMARFPARDTLGQGLVASIALEYTLDCSDWYRMC